MGELSMRRLKCPACKSTALYQEISVVAKMKLNGKMVYGVEMWNIDNAFEDSCGCEKCGWQGKFDEITGDKT